MRTESPLAAATSYHRRGWQTTPVKYHDKVAVLKNWPQQRLTDNDLLRHFKDCRSNVGVLLGEPSNWLVDVDLDCQETVELAKRFLPPTLTFGREGKRASHWLYVSEGTKSQRFQDTCGSVLAEIRSSKAYTVFPGSTYPDGRIEFDAAVDASLPESIAADELRTRVERLAAAAIIAREWPVKGGRQEAAMALAGGLARSAWQATDIAHFIDAVVAAAASEKETEESERKARSRTAEAAVQRHKSGQALKGWTTLRGSLRDASALKRATRWLGIGSDASETPRGTAEDASRDGEGNRKGGGGNGAQKLTAWILEQECDLFHDDQNRTYVSVSMHGHRQTWPLKSHQFRLYLGHQHYSVERRPAPEQAVQDALATLEARALFEGPLRQVHTRVAAHEDAVYLDLGDPHGGVVRIDAAGWSEQNDCPVRFLRPKGLQALPRPQRGGDLGELRKYLNLPDDDGWILTCSWLVGALQPRGPFPVLLLHGEQGAAKSTTARVLRGLIDPVSAPVRSEPSTVRDLMISASNCRVLVYDNLSTVPTWLSDAFCRLSTGGGFCTRQLHSNDEETIFDAQRPVILTGIEEVVTRGDLLDRVLGVRLPAISKCNRRSEQELVSGFEEERPLLLGALLDVVAAAIHGLPAARSTARLPRLADFVAWIRAAESMLPWEPGGFDQACAANTEAKVELVLEGSPVAQAAIDFAKRRGSWQGTSTDLLTQLSGHVLDPLVRKQKSWPANAQTLSRLLVDRLAPHLLHHGVRVTRSPRSGERRALILEYSPELASRASEASPHRSNP